MTTILGSCVTACLFDPRAKVGGMNHFLLPDSAETMQGSLAYGLNAMELLVNGMLKKGASRTNIHVKLIGGAMMLSGLSDIGQRNVVFARKFAANEGFKIVSESVGGTNARRVRFWPTTGKAQLKVIQGVCLKEDVAPAKAAPTGDIELF